MTESPIGPVPDTRLTRQGTAAEMAIANIIRKMVSEAEALAKSKMEHYENSFTHGWVEGLRLAAAMIDERADEKPGAH